MSETLKQLFPNIRTEEAIIGEIKSDENLLAEYESWTELQQRDFLKFCSGMRGVKVLYDGFGKEILSPIYHPERLEELLSCILETEVKTVRLYQVTERELQMSRVLLLWILW